MIAKKNRWILISLSSLAIGSTFAISEEIISLSIDSFLPDTSQVINFRRQGSITFLSTNGEVIQKIGPATRDKVSPGMMPEIVQNAFIAAEDRRFYYHRGVDLWGIVRAIISNLQDKGINEGGSTITQQLARITFLNQDKTLSRKIKEILLAYKLERQLTKKEILEQYLNYVYLGSGAYGISDAAWVYFSKRPDELSIEEAALIAGLPPAPSVYSPFVNYDFAIERRAIVLQKMFLEGFISQEEFLAAKDSPLTLKPGSPKYLSSTAPFFSDWARQKLAELLTPEIIEKGGLSVRTSLNLEWQNAAQEIIRSQSPEDIEGALISIEPGTGLVRVLVGGKNYEQNQFNRATQALRSTGSTFKIFPYAAALTAGFTPDQKILDIPRCWENYCPKNFGNKYMGRVSISDSLKYSLNSVAVSLVEQVGFDSVLEIASKLGVGNDRKLGNYYSLAIGASEHTVLEMTAAYAGITNRGIVLIPSPFEEIRGPDNNILWSHIEDHPAGQRALSVEVADNMNFMLQEVVESGTGIAAYLQNRPVAGKTGTSDKARDLWFIGSIPQLTTGVWLGYDNNKPTSKGSGDAAKVWSDFMYQIESSFGVQQFK